MERAEEVLRQENERQNERLEALEGLGIVDLSFEEDERNLSIELANGEVFETTITSEQFSMEVVNGDLIITIGDQTHRVALPVGAQSDWTETDPDDPSFIKNKIPIWITEGTPQDNMSPVDNITDGEMRPPTSNAVYDKIASLDVASVGGSGKYIESISEVDGKIVAVEQNIADTVTVDNMQSVSSNAVSKAISFSETEHQVGYWIDGKPLYEKTFVMAVQQNGSFAYGIPTNERVKDWRGNFFQTSIENPSWIMHIPYTYLGNPISDWIMIYVYATIGRFECSFLGGGMYAGGYFNGYAVITYKYTKS